MKIKDKIKEIQRVSPEGTKNKNVWRFRRDMKSLKYVQRIKNREDFKISRKSIAELSPWTLKMVKVILNHYVIDVKSGIEEILIRGATAEEYEKAFSASPIFDRLANMAYGKTGSQSKVSGQNSYQLEI